MDDLVSKIKDGDAETFAALNALDGRLVALEALGLQSAPVYEYREIWGEEAAVINNDSAEFSYGNGATGQVGMPHLGEDGWEVVGMYFNADLFAIGSSATFKAKQFSSHAQVISQDDICEIFIDDTLPDVGSNLASHYESFDPPLPLPYPTSFRAIGFYTVSTSGGITDVRLGLRMRKKIGDYALISA